MAKSMEEVIIAFSEKYEGDFKKVYEAIANKEDLTDEEIDQYTSMVENNVVTVISEDYPTIFKHVKCPPIALYYEGNLDLVDESINCFANPYDKNKRVYFNIDFTKDGTDYFLGCENEADLEPMYDYFIGQFPELNFINYKEKEGMSACA